MAALLMAGAVVTPLVFDTSTEDVFALPKLVALLVVTAACAIALVSAPWRERLPRWRRADTAVTAFVLIHVAAFVASIDPAQSLWGEQYQYQGLVSVLLYATAYGMARVALRTPRARRFLSASIVAGAVLVSFYAVAQRIGFDPIWDDLARGGRVFSTLGQPNALGAYLALALPLTAVLAGSDRAARRRTGAMAASLIGSGLVLTHSRGAYLGAATAAGLLVALNADLLRANRQAVARALGTMALVLVAAAVLVAPVRAATKAAGERAWGIVDTDIDDSADKHLDLWTVGVHMAIDRPLLGAGQETYPTLFREYSGRVLAPDRQAVFAGHRPESPHNVYIATASGAGTGALIALLVVLTEAGRAVVRGTRRSERHTDRLTISAIGAAVAAHVVTDLFMTGELTGSWLAWLLAGAVVSAAQSATAEPRAAPASMPDCGQLSF